MENRYLCKAKRTDNGEWVIGSYVYTFNEDKKCPVIGVMTENHWIVEENGNIVLVNKDTFCQYTGLTDKNGNKIWENDILAYNVWGNCTGVVKYGTYIQDGSGGEYNGMECIGYYVEMARLVPYEWSDESIGEALESFPDYYKKYSLAEITTRKNFAANKAGNIFDNPELLEGGV